MGKSLTNTGTKKGSAVSVTIVTEYVRAQGKVSVLAQMRRVVVYENAACVQRYNVAVFKKRSFGAKKGLIKRRGLQYRDIAI